MVVIFTFYLFFTIFTYSAAPGLSCGMQNYHLRHASSQYVDLVPRPGVEENERVLEKSLDGTVLPPWEEKSQGWE